MARKHSECKSALQPGQMAGDLGLEPSSESLVRHVAWDWCSKGWISKGSLGDQTLEDVVLALEAND